MLYYTFNALSATSLLAANLVKQTDPIKYSLKSTTPWFSYKIPNNITYKILSGRITDVKKKLEALILASR